LLPSVHLPLISEFLPFFTPVHSEVFSLDLLNSPLVLPFYPPVLPIVLPYFPAFLPVDLSLIPEIFSLHIPIHHVFLPVYPIGLHEIIVLLLSECPLGIAPIGITVGISHFLLLHYFSFPIVIGLPDLLVHNLLLIFLLDNLLLCILVIGHLLSILVIHYIIVKCILPHLVDSALLFHLPIILVDGGHFLGLHHIRHNHVSHEIAPHPDIL
jgi:hypothetical protein